MVFEKKSCMFAQDFPKLSEEHCDKPDQGKIPRPCFEQVTYIFLKIPCSLNIVIVIHFFHFLLTGEPLRVDGSSECRF